MRGEHHSLNHVTRVNETVSQTESQRTIKISCFVQLHRRQQVPKSDSRHENRVLEDHSTFREKQNPVLTVWKTSSIADIRR